MPTLLEQPPVVETPIRRASAEAASDKGLQQPTQLETELQSGTKKMIIMKLHEIFEGHEEFLGWTPD